MATRVSLKERNLENFAFEQDGSKISFSLYDEKIVLDLQNFDDLTSAKRLLLYLQNVIHVFEVKEKNDKANI